MGTDPIAGPGVVSEVRAVALAAAYLPRLTKCPQIGQRLALNSAGFLVGGQTRLTAAKLFWIRGPIAMLLATSMRGAGLQRLAIC